MTTTNDNAPRPAWFDDLLVKYTPFLLKQCSKRTSDPDDLMQDVRILAMVNWKKYKEGPDGGFPLWLRYLVLTAWREGRRKAIHTITIDDGHDVAMPAPQEHAIDINLALRLCDQRQRSVVLMYSAGYLHREIAEALGMSRIWAMKLFQDAQELVAVNARAVNASGLAASRVAA